ncbi:MAG: HAD family hydrolase, partial [Phycisphaeraceae bacterium]
DGTLLSTSGAGVRAMRRVGADLFGEHFTINGMTFGGGLDPAIFAEAAKRNELDDHHLHHDRFRDAYLAELERALAEGHARPHPGILEVLEALRPRCGDGKEFVLGLLTGNYSRAAPLKLAAAGIDPDWFTLTAFGDEGDTRPELVQVALRKYHQQTGLPADPRRVVVIGDTPRDVDCAKAHGCVAFCVATGSYSEVELRDAGADVVVPDLSDAGPLLELIDSLPGPHCAEGFSADS